MLKLNIDNRNLTVSESVITSLLSLLSVRLQELLIEKAPPVVSIFLDQFVRKQLYDMEKKIYAESGDKELAKSVRPAKNQSPMQKGIELIIPHVKEMLQNVEVGFSTDNDDNISHITVKLTDTSKAW